MPDPVAVLLFNLGGPDDLASVEPFLVNLFTDREIIRLPGGARLQPAFARVIAKLRGPAVRENYRRIGGGSPQLRITREQAAALEARLNDGDGGPPCRVFMAMRYSRPSTADAVEAIVAAGIRRIVTVPLFPQWSRATTGSSRLELARTLRNGDWARVPFEVAHVDSYADEPLYLDAMADTVRAAWDRIPEARRARAVLLFSAHGLPQRFVNEGDPYVGQIDRTRFGILERLNLPNRQLLAFQSRTGPVTWIGPGTGEVIAELGEEGVSDVLVVPLSFVSDHIETLYEVDLLFAEVARAAGITGYYRPAALNTHPLFIEALAGLVRRRLDWHTGAAPPQSPSATLAAAGAA